jgi:GNAT superfamily N-acetyltransferase
MIENSHDDVEREFAVRDGDSSDAHWIRTLLVEHWHGTVMAMHGELIDASRCPALIAVDAGGARIGLLTYRDDERGREVISLNALREGMGVGGALLDAAASGARRAGHQRIWLITTNDNLRALGFYQRRGYDLLAVHHDAVTRTRETVKPRIPLISDDGIPIRHELELARPLTG